MVILTIGSVVGVDGDAEPALDILSNCAYSYTINSLLGSSRQMPKSVLGATPVPNPTLNMFNAAFGTTGTRSVYKNDLKEYGSGCHWTDCDPKSDGRENPFPDHFNRIRDCIDGTKYGKRCLTDTWMLELREMLEKFVTSDIRMLTDTPVSYLFGELRNMVPNITVKHTVRNVHYWAVKRIADHPKGDLICADHTQSLNPFNILDCMVSSKYLQDNVVTTISYIGMDIDAANQYLQGARIPEQVNRKIKLVGRHFAAFNSYILLNTDPEHYEPICVWDLPKE